jgi:hypothetical protein
VARFSNCQKCGGKRERVSGVRRCIPCLREIQARWRARDKKERAEAKKRVAHYPFTPCGTCGGPREWWGGKVQCKPCQTAMGLSWRLRNAERYRAYDKKYQREYNLREEVRDHKALVAAGLLTVKSRKGEGKGTPMEVTLAKRAAAVILRYDVRGLPRNSRKQQEVRA